MYPGGALPPNSLYSIYTAQGAQCNTSTTLYASYFPTNLMCSNIQRSYVQCQVVRVRSRIRPDPLYPLCPTNLRSTHAQTTKASGLTVDAYQRHHWKSVIMPVDVNGVAGISWATNKSASAWSTAIAFYPRVTRGVIYISAEKAAVYRI